MKYKESYKRSIQDPEEFWKEQAQNLEWYKQPSQIVSKDDNNQIRWFVDGKLNVSYLCIDKHIKDGYGNQTAIIYDSPVTNTQQHITYNELLEEVEKLAGGLQQLGLKKGDTTIIYMPMIPQAVYAMLACARIGVIHSVVFGGFAPHELAIRIDDCKPKIIITASNGVEIDRVIPYKPFVDKAIKEATHKPNHVIIFDRKLGVNISYKSHDIDYDSLLAKALIAKPIKVESTHPLYILYTSGTTGTPKGVVRDSGGYATALKYSIQQVYGVNEGDTFWAASDIGWVVGHSFSVYGPLINRNTTILFEGKPTKTPDASTYWRVISEHKVKSMFTAPTAIRAIKKEDPNGRLMKQFDMANFKYLFLAGERCDITTLKWLKEKLRIPVIDHWWQTESGWPMIANMVGLELQKIKLGSSTLPVCGYDIQILDEQGISVPANTEGYVVAKLPLPPGTLTNLWKNPKLFKKSYLNRFKGYYFSGDGGYKDEDGYIYITGRVDDIINVAGHRLSTADMEEVVSSHEAVTECAVFGIHCDLKGQKPLGLVVLKSGIFIEQEQLQSEIVKEVRSTIGAVTSFKDVLIVNRLPKTRTGKILRKLLRNIADNNKYEIPSTIDDENIIKEIEHVFKTYNTEKRIKELQ